LVLLSPSAAVPDPDLPPLPGAERNPNYDEKKFEKFARLAVETATALFNSPRSVKRLPAWVGPMAATCGWTFVGAALA
jgi:hypothetical protein